ncbi:TonB-dependent receptor plug domain-containing protein [Urechidicola croceus]|uniref:TonB-dependent receptor plug domain-containing protein n=1 Tax=Urechidicola croceus TaxID=1850246 RepID=A0A1D8PAZ7_9FLAO|nr:TonB-dependent receptor plug domain-containing protein [Urechidicola croceus]AOW21742.1 hypothetical protein LPB138_14105 [Urechidicola croceus]
MNDLAKLSIIFLVLILASCKSNQKIILSTEQDAKDVTTENKVIVNEINIGNDLTSQLRGLPGVHISGSGANAIITIRGNNSISLTSEPLFVIDGQQFSGTYSSLYNTISINNIKTIKVLKDAASLGYYGSSGSNGVIEITTKN